MSGAQVAYHLRVNKFIDRALFLESLDMYSRIFSINDHVYVSMGGAYLEDFRVIHRATRISRMVSFDESPAVLARQVINMPFGFIKLRRRKSDEVIAKLSDIRNQVGRPDSNVIMWFDYTRPGERLSQLQEIETLIPKLIAGDIIRVTMNAHRPTLGENPAYQALPVGDRPATLARWRLHRLQDQLGKYTPASADADVLDTKQGLYTLILRSIGDVVVNAINPRCELQAVPLLATAYDDQHGMVTVTFAIQATSEASTLVDALRGVKDGLNSAVRWDDFVEIEVPALSVRERQLLHGLMQSGGAFAAQKVKFITTNQLEQYRLHYCRYPTFAPLDIL